MRNIFSSYYRPTDEEFTEMWNSGHFIFDANVLLKLYKYSHTTLDELMEIFSSFSDQLWLPYQVALEYYRGRPKIIVGQVRELEIIENALKKFQIGALSNQIAEIISEIIKLHSTHHGLLTNDPIRDSLEELFNNKVGDSYDEEQITTTKKDGEKRYKSKIPPGFQDKDKPESLKYGDLFIWYQIMDHAEEVEKPIIFVTDDRKEDWWWKEDDRTVGPRPELLEELKKKSDQDFWMYSTDRFMEHAKQYRETEVEDEVIDEVREIREKDELISRSYGPYESGSAFSRITEAALKAQQMAYTPLDIVNYLSRDRQKFQALVDSLKIVPSFTQDDLIRNAALDTIQRQLAMAEIYRAADKKKEKEEEETEDNEIESPNELEKDDKTED